MCAGPRLEPRKSIDKRLLWHSRIRVILIGADYNGSMAQCPGMMRAGCFPFGTLDDVRRTRDPHPPGTMVAGRPHPAMRLRLLTPPPRAVAALALRYIRPALPQDLHGALPGVRARASIRGDPRARPLVEKPYAELSQCLRTLRRALATRVLQRPKGWEAPTLRHGADVLVPAGLALLAARGAPRIPDKCKGLIDEEYPYSDPLRKLRLPLSAADPADARWATPEAAKALFNDLGPGYNSTFCNDGCHLDHHPSVLAQYLNALVFFATLFKKSPLGAAAPDGTQRVDGMLLPALGAPEHAPVLQRIARDVVMPHLDTWWGKYARDGTDAVSPPVGPVPDS